MGKRNIQNIIVTLYEGNYHFGVASLINSLVSSKYNGLIRVGYKGELPRWINQLKKVDDIYEANNDIIISFVPLNPDMHFGYYKPYFLKDSLQEYPTAENIYYFDPDIVVHAPWPFFTSWVNVGICLCLDNCFPYLHRNHPWRKEWKILGGENSDAISNIDYYVNSGFIGLTRSNISLLDTWIKLTEIYRQRGGNTHVFEKAEGSRAVKTDQDLLNAVITISTDLNLSIIGTEGMGFTQPAYLMAHAVNNIKPWKKKFTKFLFTNGKSPSLLEGSYMKFANSPICAYDKFSFNLKQIDFKIAALLGRIFG